jgi:G3E family GTPase
MNKKPKIFFVGGFLGAGKTTAIQGLAKIYAEKGLKAAAITNDQAVGLVDTFFLSRSGVPTLEVAGSCFCCNFDGLAEAIEHSISSIAPDVILAEPVGSCTDIVATVIRPMRTLMKDKVEVYAYSVLVEPDRWKELAGETAPWSMKYLFDKQLLEADFIVLTKLDTLTPERAEELPAEISRLYPASKVLTISAYQGAGMKNWLSLVGSTPPGEHRLEEIDYHTYAQAEAEMGWLNGLITMKFSEPTDGKTITWRMAQRLTESIKQRNGSIGHLKLLAVGDTGSMKAGVTQVNEKPMLDGAFTGPLTYMEVTVNLRATLSPGDLSSILHELVGQCRESDKALTEISTMNTFRPGASNPTHRL